MVEIASPLGQDFRPGRHGMPEGEPGVRLSMRRPVSIVQVAAWPGKGKAVLAATLKAAGLALNGNDGVARDGRCLLAVAPDRWLVIDEERDLLPALRKAVAPDAGAVLSLAHGRTIFRVEGPRAGFVLAKLFAIDFSIEAFPVCHAVSTAHHDVFAAIQRVRGDAFDLCVFTSFARSFWQTLGHAAGETGYEVVAP